MSFVFFFFPEMVPSQNAIKRRFSCLLAQFFNTLLSGTQTHQGWAPFDSPFAVSVCLLNEPRWPEHVSVQD